MLRLFICSFGARRVLATLSQQSNKWKTKQNLCNLILFRTILNDKLFYGKKKFEFQDLKKRKEIVIPNERYVIEAASADDVVMYVKCSIEYGRFVGREDVLNIINHLQELGEYQKALSVSEWMQTIYRYDTGDYVFHLDLVAEVHGAAAAERQFTCLPKVCQDIRTNAAVLRGYVKKKMNREAEALMRKLSTRGYGRAIELYNEMMALYISTNQPEKVLSVIRLLRIKDIPHNADTYNNWLHACAAMSDVDSINKIIYEIKAAQESNVNWSTYSTLASIFIELQFPCRAKVFVQKLEKEKVSIPLKACDHLISLHGDLRNMTGVYEVWRFIENKFGGHFFSNYISMHSSLIKMREIRGAKNIFHEWIRKMDTKGFNSSLKFIDNYIKAGLYHEAESFHSELVKGNSASRKWETLAQLYLSNNLKDKAVILLKRAIKEAEVTSWEPKTKVMNEILKYLESKGDMDSMKELLRFLKDNECGFMSYNHFSPSNTRTSFGILRSKNSL